MWQIEPRRVERISLAQVPPQNQPNNRPAQGLFDDIKQAANVISGERQGSPQAKEARGAGLHLAAKPTRAAASRPGPWTGQMGGLRAYRRRHGRPASRRGCAKTPSSRACPPMLRPLYGEQLLTDSDPLRTGRVGAVRRTSCVIRQECTST